VEIASYDAWGPASVSEYDGVVVGGTSGDDIAVNFAVNGFTEDGGGCVDGGFALIGGDGLPGCVVGGGISEVFGCLFVALTFSSLLFVSTWVASAASVVSIGVMAAALMGSADADMASEGAGGWRESSLLLEITISEAFTVVVRSAVLVELPMELTTGMTVEEEEAG